MRRGGGSFFKKCFNILNSIDMMSSFMLPGDGEYILAMSHLLFFIVFLG